MAPKAVDSGGRPPKFINRGIPIMLDTISVGEQSGWRPHDVSRQQEIKADLMHGKYGHSILRDPQLLKSARDSRYLLDPSGLILVGDGLQFISALKSIQKDWQTAGQPDARSQAGDETEAGEFFDSRVIEIFVKGLVCDVVAFDTDEPLLRLTWYASTHDEENVRSAAATAWVK